MKNKTFQTTLIFFMTFATIFFMWFISIEYHEQSHIRVAEENFCSYDRVNFNQVNINCENSPYDMNTINQANLLMEGLFYNITMPLLIIFTLLISIVGGWLS